MDCHKMLRSETVKVTGYRTLQNTLRVLQTNLKVRTVTVPINTSVTEDFHARTKKVTYLALAPLAPLDSALWNLSDI